MSKYEDFEGFLFASPEDQDSLRGDQGSYRTESLFEELIQKDIRLKYKPLYSLKNRDNNGCISAYQIYMSAVDETEAALKLVGNLTHWKRLCKTRWFLEGRSGVSFDGLLGWRDDMADRDSMIAKRGFMRLAKEGNMTALRELDKISKKKKTTTIKPRKSPTSSGDSDEDALLALLETTNGGTK